MLKPLLSVLLSLNFLSATAVARLADDPDPEPPSPLRSVAKSGDYTITASKTGTLTATNKQGQTLWRTILPRNLRNVAPIVGIAGGRVVAATDRTLSVLDLRTGKVFWRRESTVALGKMSIKGNQITLKSKNSVEVIDLQTGRVNRSNQK